ncbi:MAG: hypothetical protein KDC67_09940, partial [Ignavibacteriae bacterium]|nr:hypothetical protein [Ignavibacteriota bacterium]
DKISLKDIKNSKMHPAIINYIFRAIDEQLLNDRQLLLEKSKFDYSGEKIENYLKLISDEIKKKNSFDFTQINELIIGAVDFNSRFLNQPNHTILDFIFKSKKSKTIAEITASLKYLYYFKYIKKISLSYLNKKNIPNIDRKEFALLLKKIDAISKKTNLQNMMNTAVNSMTDFYEQFNETPQRLPYEAIRLYLEEKELTNFLQKLELQYEFKKPKSLLIPELNELILSDYDAIKIRKNKGSDSTKKDPSENDILTDEIAENNDENTISINVEEVKVINENDDDIIKEEAESSDDKINDVDGNNDSLVEKRLSEVDSEFKVEEKNKISEEKIIDVEAKENKIAVSKKDIQIEKPNVKKLVRELIDLNPIYNSLLSSPIPFSDKKNYLEIFASSFDNELNYQIDYSTLNENLLIEIPEEEEYIGVVNQNEDIDVVENESDNLENKIVEIENNYPDLKESSVVSVDEELKNEINIENTIDDVVFNKKYEEEFLKGEYDLDNENIEGEQNSELINKIDNDEVKFSHEADGEITEVFTDLSFLDKADEIDSESTFRTKSEIKEAALEKENRKNKEIEDSNFDNENNSDNEVKVIYSTFQEFLLQKEMTNIIETIFDYDMEDYYQLIGEISNSSTEQEGIKVTNNYCGNNHIDILNDEVMIFKSFISDFFSQTQ